MKSIYIGIICIFCLFDVSAQKGKKVQFMGGARSLVSHSDISSDGDTVTAPRSTGGYALLDVGIKINPNKNTEVLGMFRINNAFGGFWGGGVTFGVRQLYVRGVARDIFRYHIGNIDYKLTPYTFFNHNQDFLTSSIGTNRIKQDVVDYETFYSNNTWRQQGASLNFALEFPKIVNEVEFNGFVTRLNPTNFNNILERLYGGGNIIVTQSKHVQLGINHVSVFDLAGTAVDSNIYNNNVSSLTYNLTFGEDDMIYGLDGESGIGSTSQALFPENDLSDYFIHARGYLNLKKLGLNIDLGYMDNGPDFRSFGAQSKRVNYNAENTFFNRYTNGQILRAISAYDLYNDPTLYNQGISVGLMDYNPAINNVMPYGIATFNRRGAYLGASYHDKKKIVEANTKVYFLNEVRGQGTEALKSFLMANVGVMVHANKLWEGKKEWNVQLGLMQEQTTRTGEFDFENVNLSSTQLNIGLEGEIVDNLFLMGNVFMLSASGNEQLPVRDKDDAIVNYQAYTVNGRELNISGGLRLDFSQDVYLALMYESNANNFVTDAAYQLDQFSIFYVMKF
ncbi:hypothetical protein N9L43_00390 [bacterium]|nr:hypothetical protein [bacterium]MDB3906252.1 hypothetical protein [Crocinitomicaceae bacterium]